MNENENFYEEEYIITVTDVKNYIYCPKIVYFNRVLNIKPLLYSQQKESLKEHKDMENIEKRRKDSIFYSKELINTEKIFKIKLYSKRLNLIGILDCLIIDKIKRLYIPIDYKYMASKNGKAWIDHKYQLTSYAMLIEDTYNTIVRKGFIYYVPEKLIKEILITNGMKKYLKKVLRKIDEIIIYEKFPNIRISNRKCSGGCGYKHVCKE